MTDLYRDDVEIQRLIFKIFKEATKYIDEPMPLKWWKIELAKQLEIRILNNTIDDDEMSSVSKLIIRIKDKKYLNELMAYMINDWWNVNFDDDMVNLPTLIKIKFSGKTCYITPQFICNGRNGDLTAEELFDLFLKTKYTKRDFRWTMKNKTDLMKGFYKASLINVAIEKDKKYGLTYKVRDLEEEINELKAKPKMEIPKFLLNEIYDKCDFKCPICMRGKDEISKEDFKITSCGHKFCKECLEKSLEIKNKCPVCCVSL